MVDIDHYIHLIIATPENHVSTVGTTDLYVCARRTSGHYNNLSELLRDHDADGAFCKVPELL